MKVRDIVEGHTYRFFGATGRELKPRTVVRYDPNDPMPGGYVRAHAGPAISGGPPYVETMAGEYFAEHAEPR